MNLPKLIIAFDFESLEKARPLMRALQGLPVMAKIGLELFSAEGPKCISVFRDAGFSVFLDLKLHDIPNTVAHATRACVRWKADFLTVHTAGGLEMLRRAQQEVEGTSTRLLGVSVLTSMDEDDLTETGCGTLENVLKKRAQLAQNAGFFGLVCSGQDLDVLKPTFKQSLRFVVPGIRLNSGSVEDQKRVLTPEEACARGADWLVVGRPISQSENPHKQAELFLNALKGTEV